MLPPQSVEGRHFEIQAMPYWPYKKGLIKDQHARGVLRFPTLSLLEYSWIQSSGEEHFNKYVILSFASVDNILWCRQVLTTIIQLKSVQQ